MSHWTTICLLIASLIRTTNIHRGYESTYFKKKKKQVFTEVKGLLDITHLATRSIKCSSIGSWRFLQFNNITDESTEKATGRIRKSATEGLVNLHRSNCQSHYLNLLSIPTPSNWVTLLYILRHISLIPSVDIKDIWRKWGRKGREGKRILMMLTSNSGDSWKDTLLPGHL